MIAKWFQKPQCLIGIDVGTQAVRMAQLDLSSDRPALVAVGHRAIKRDCGSPIEAGYGESFHNSVADAISELMHAEDFTGKASVSCLPSAVMHYKNLRLPKMPADELPAAVKWEASDRLHLGEPATVQFYDAGSVRQGEEDRQEIILLAATERVIEQHTRALLRVGLEPVAIDVIPSAIARCMSQGQTAGQTRLVIDVGYASSKVLICCDDHVLFYKQINLGGEVFDEAVSKHLNLNIRESSELRKNIENQNEQTRRSVEESLHPKMVELSREVGLCLRYYSVTFRGQRPEHACLLGGESQNDKLATVLSEGAGITVRRIDPLAGIDLSQLSQPLDDKSQWATAVGLALRSASKTGAKRGAA